MNDQHTLPDNTTSQSKRIIYGKDARESLKKGIDQVADAVKTTLGPAGRTVLIGFPDRSPIITKDGVTVARSIKLSGLEAQGANLLIDCTTRSNIDSGDGSTTCSVITQSLCDGLTQLLEIMPHSDLQQGMKLAAQDILKYLRQSSRKITSGKQIKAIATISGNSEEIGNLLFKAFDHVGDEGIISIVPSRNRQTEIEFTKGLDFPSGWASPVFINNPQKGLAEYEDPYFFITDENLSLAEQAINLLNLCGSLQKPLIVICRKVSLDALQTFEANRHKQGFPIVVINAPYVQKTREWFLEDLAYATGAQVITNAMGVNSETVKKENLGKATKVVVTQNATLIVEGKGDVTTRVSQLKHFMEGLPELEQLPLKERIGKITNSIATIRIGASSDAEMIEAQHRWEDALNATKRALSFGIVEGGGFALYRAAQRAISKLTKYPKELQIGYKVFCDAAMSPAEQVQSNAGFSKFTFHPTKGFNSRTGQLGSLFHQGVIDPLSVVEASLQNALSIAIVYSSLDCIILRDS